MHGSDEMVEESVQFYRKQSGYISLDDNASPYPRPLLNTQSFIEKVFVDCLAKLGISVEYLSEAVDYVEGEFARTQVKNALGELTG